MGQAQSKADLRPLKFSLGRPPVSASIFTTLCFAACGSDRDLGALWVQAQAGPGTREIAFGLCSPPARPKRNALLSLVYQFFEKLGQRAHTKG